MRTTISAFWCAVAAASIYACAPAEDDAAGGDQAAVEKEIDLYDAPGALSVKFSAPFSTLFARLKNWDEDKMPEGGDPAKFKSGAFSEPGKVIFKVGATEKVVDTRFYIRGESSKSDCPFPKLKLDFSDKEQLKGTPFKGHGEVRINTHCGPGDQQTRSELGRVMHGVGPVREELAYRVVRAMGINTYKSRVLAVTYDDTASKEQTVTFAMALESGDDAAHRFTKLGLVEEGAELLDSAKTSTEENKAYVAIGQAFAGNKDWNFNGHNTDFFGKEDAPGGYMIPQDFDLGAVVLADVAKYWKGMAQIADAAEHLKKPGVAALIKAHQADVLKALDDAEATAIKAKAVTGKAKKSTDPGFAEARKRVTELFDRPEVKEAEPAAPAAPPAEKPAEPPPGG